MKLFLFVLMILVQTVQADEEMIFDCHATEPESSFQDVNLTLSENLGQVKVKELKVLAPVFGINETKKLKVKAVNEFTFIGSLLDEEAQENVSFSVILDNNKDEIHIFSRYDVNSGVTSEKIKCQARE